jgi:transcriptional regulator with XRE-family HTH domain
MGLARKIGPSGFGTKMRRLREKKGLRLEDLANQTGLSPEYLEKIERHEEIPPVAAILQISKALSLDAGSFLATREKDVLEKGKIESYEKRTRSYAYRSLCPGARTKHLRAFLVSIDPHQDHDMVEYRHEGEEFIYVLDGRVEVTVGAHVNNLASGQSLHFNSGIRHMLRNPGAKRAELLVVLYTP